jgi:hypothetical protein
MAIGSVLNPEKIVGKQNINQKLAKNFISGDSFLGTSSIASAANKIVGFQRGTTKPVPSSVDSIVSTISTNITNNITSTLNNTLQSFTTDYKKRVSDVDSAKPTGILSKFLSTYKSVIQFIQFFGNKKFVNGISDNLKNLSKSFTESFEVAKLIRQVIVKIVQQLSNLPKASPGGGGGIDIDVDVPMGGVRKSAPRGLGNMFKGRGKMLALGAGALGLGAVGAGTVNALSNVDEIRAGMFQPGDGGDIISTFGSVIERFIAAINTMVGIGKGPSKPPGGGGGGGGGGGPGPGGPGPGGPGPGGPVDLSKISGDTPEQKAFLATVGSTEAGSYDTIVGGEKVPELTQMSIQEVYDMGMKGRIGEGTLPQRFGGRKIKYGADSHAMGRYQFIPQTMMGAMRSAGLKPTDVYSPENQDKMALAFSTSIGIDVNRAMTESDYKKAGSSVAWEGMRKISYAEAKKRYDAYLSQAKTSTAKPGIGGSYEELPKEYAAAYKAGKLKLEEYKNLATNVSQPAQSAVQSQTNIVPIDLSGAMPQQSQGGGGGVSAPPSTQKNGPSVPLLPSANTDNFLVLYSRMVYNIVDG